MKQVKRFDSGSMQPPVKLANGWMRADAWLTRVGVFTYLRADGSTYRELRPPEEVFRSDSLETLRQVPLTLDHPSEGDGMLTAENAKQYTVGNVGYGYQDYDGYYVQGPVLITDKAAVDAVEKGKTEVSCAYTADMDETPGEWMGQTYDAVQRNIKYNHVAIVDEGRAGSSVRIKLDAKDAIQIETPRKENTMKVLIENNSHDISDAAARDLEKERATTQAKLDAAEARAKAAETNAAKAQVKLDAIEAEANKQKRTAFETEAKKILGAEAKLDGLSEIEVKLQVIKKLQPEAKLDGKSADYVAAYYDAIIQTAPETSAPQQTTPALAQARADANDVKVTISGTDPEAARKRMHEENRNAWKTKAS
jgi:hypothetical protein